MTNVNRKHLNYQISKSVRVPDYIIDKVKLRYANSQYYTSDDHNSIHMDGQGDTVILSNLCKLYNVNLHLFNHTGNGKGSYVYFDNGADTSMFIVRVGEESGNSGHFLVIQPKINVVYKPKNSIKSKVDNKYNLFQSTTTYDNIHEVQTATSNHLNLQQITIIPPEPTYQVEIDDVHSVGLEIIRDVDEVIDLEITKYDPFAFRQSHYPDRLVSHSYVTNKETGEVTVEKVKHLRDLPSHFGLTYVTNYINSDPDTQSKKPFKVFQDTGFINLDLLLKDDLSQVVDSELYYSLMWHVMGKVRTLDSIPAIKRQINNLLAPYDLSKYTPKEIYNIQTNLVKLALEPHPHETDLINRFESLDRLRRVNQFNNTLQQGIKVRESIMHRICRMFIVTPGKFLDFVVNPHYVDMPSKIRT